MSRHPPLIGFILTVALAAFAGCQPEQPFYLHHVDCDLAHYKGVATEIEYPDVDAERLPDVACAQRPFSLLNKDPKNYWDLTLEEAIKIALTNSKVLRGFAPGRDVPINGETVPDFLLADSEHATTMYDPALAETDPQSSAEAALSAFDAQFASSLLWERTNTPLNVNPNLLAIGSPDVSEHDIGKFQAQLSKTTATGGQFSLTHTLAYDMDRFPYPPAIPGVTFGAPYAYPADWNVNLQAEWRQPLLQGAGVQFNRIAGPGAVPGAYRGVMIARIRTDETLALFESNIRIFIRNVEDNYWELYFRYRSFDSAIHGRDSALKTWQMTHTKAVTGSKGGEAEAESQAREHYYSFRSTAEGALTELYAMEGNLRILLGLAATDGRLIRPKDEPTTAKVAFDWCEVLSEGLVRNVDLRRQKWTVKRRELELIAAKNFLLPKLDFDAQYRWLGLGNRLDGANPLPDLATAGVPPPDSNAYRTLTDGQFQEWQIGLQLNVPLGFRREMAGVRNAQLQLARERAVLQEQELELSHDLAGDIRHLEGHYVLTQTNFNRRIAAQHEVEAVTAAFETDTVTIDRVLEAQRNLAEAESAYFRSLVDYNEQVTQVHFHKGSLLEYNGVYLAEGPWPGKAYFDARRRARARDAGLYLDYGFTQPRVISRGPIEQNAGCGVMPGAGQMQAPPAANPAGPQPAAGQPELVPTPEAEPMQSGPAPAQPQASATGRGQQTRGWTAAEEGSNHESGAYPPSAAIDRPASGWTGVQH